MSVRSDYRAMRLARLAGAVQAGVILAAFALGVAAGVIFF